MPIRISHFEDMSNEELEHLRRQKHHRGDPAMHELLSRVEAGMAQRVPIAEGQSGKGLRIAIARAAGKRGLSVETAEGDGCVGVWLAPEATQTKAKRPASDSRRGRPRKGNQEHSLADLISSADQEEDAEIAYQQDLALSEA